MHFVARAVVRFCVAVSIAIAPVLSPFAAAQDLSGLFGALLSPQQEAQIGSEQHPQILQEFGGAYDDPELSAYVDSIGQFLAQTQDRSDVNYTFTVLNSPVVNAFALPGGYVYVTRGLLALADTEAELAGVLAHEIGHVAARHGAERYGQGVVANLGLTLLGMVTKSEAIAGVAQLGALAAIQGYSREQEHEADFLGVQYLSRAGFDPGAMSGFLNKLGAHSRLQGEILGQSDAGGFDIFATHPRTADRVQRAIAAAGVQSVQDPIIARDIYLEKIDGLLFGDDPKQGLVKGTRFIHPDLGFAFEVPDGFTLLNGTQQVLARGPDGAVIRFDAAPRDDGRGPVAHLSEVWAPDANLRNIEPIRINGFDAATAAVRNGEGAEALDTQLVAIAFDTQTIYRFLFATPPNVTSAMNEGFRRTTYSFRRLAPGEVDNIEPHRLTLRRVQAGESVDLLSARYPFPDHQRRRFQVLNGLTEGQTLVEGQLVKMIVE